MHARTRIQEQQLPRWTTAAIERVVLGEELVVACDLLAGERVLEVGVEPHRRAAVRRQARDRGADARVLILPERERLVVERAAQVACLQRSLAVVPLREICV